MFRKSFVASVVVSLAILGGSATGADHAESPGADADSAGDLADVFLFRSPENSSRMVGAITFGGRPLPRSRIDQTFYCDPKVLYILNIERANAQGQFANTPTTRIFARFGKDPKTGQCGVRIENIPGAGGTVTGPIETNFTSSTGLRVFAGLRNDPFFFDAEGYNGIIAAFASPAPPGGYVVNAFGLGSRPRRDSFANRNVSTIVFEMDLDALAPASGGARPKIQVWATTARLVS